MLDVKNMKSFEVISELISSQALDLIACKKSMSIRRLFTRDFNFIRIYDDDLYKEQILLQSLYKTVVKQTYSKTQCLLVYEQ